MTRTNIIYIAILVAIIAVVALITFLIGGFSSGNQTAKTVAERLQPDGSLPYTDMDGNPVDLTNYEGKTLIVNSWATWCPFCVSELPDLNKVAEKYKNEDVIVIAINRKEPPKTARAFVKHVGNPENVIFLLDQRDQFYKSIGGFSMPETIFYEANGDVSFHKRGSMTFKEMQQRIDKVLDGDEV